MFQKYDKQYQYISYFDERTGFYIRSGILEDGKDTNIDPFMASFPELLDIGIMGHCVHGMSGLCLMAGIECYQNGLNQYEDNMSLDNFKKIIEQCKGKVFQIALGGRGDPDQHENFKKILELCRNSHIVPNFTSSGFGFNKDIVELCKQYCGAVAISWYRSAYTIEAINMLLKAKVKTNIHYVLNNQTIDEAIQRLKNNEFPKGINAMIFLLHKPIGLGTYDNTLRYDDIKVKDFFKLIDEKEYPFKIGFDSCSIPGIINMTNSIDIKSLDTCEGARWSAYITSDMKMLPCSFDNQYQRWAVDLNTHSMQQAWDSPQFEDFRNTMRSACPHCLKKNICMGGCPISPEIVLCDRKYVYS
ncbi:MAG: SPASM domain-containing protein [Erysipelotrichaceae bacterium]|nr:SPASM domain-containing protein [Erysipelotrichaceae bacterium]